MTEYHVATADNLGTLLVLVNALIKEGWTPLGGIAVAQSESSYEDSRGSHTNESVTWAQAMTRETSEWKPLAKPDYISSYPTAP